MQMTICASLQSSARNWMYCVRTVSRLVKLWSSKRNTIDMPSRPLGRCLLSRNVAFLMKTRSSEPV